MVRRWMSSLRMAQLAPREREPSAASPPLPASHSKDTTTSFAVRRAVVRDVKVLAGLWREMMEYHRSLEPDFQFGPNAQSSIERHLGETIRSTGGRVFVAEAGGRVIGYILGEIQERKPIYPAGRYGFISDLAVTEDWRRKGVGRALVTTLSSWFREHGVTAVELFILETNPISTAFWESMGFRHYLRLLRHNLASQEKQANLSSPEGAE